jgi:hypothetical protein
MHLYQGVVEDRGDNRGVAFPILQFSFVPGRSRISTDTAGTGARRDPFVEPLSPRTESSSRSGKWAAEQVAPEFLRHEVIGATPAQRREVSAARGKYGGVLLRCYCGDICADGVSTS